MRSNTIPHSRTITFAVPADADEYAPEVLYLNDDNDDPRRSLHKVDEIEGVIRSLPAGALLEMDLLKPGNLDPRDEESWNLDQGTAASAAGVFGLLKMGSWPGVRFRAKSGGAAGNLPLDLSWTEYP